MQTARLKVLPVPYARAVPVGPTRYLYQVAYSEGVVYFKSFVDMDKKGGRQRAQVWRKHCVLMIQSRTMDDSLKSHYVDPRKRISCSWIFEEDENEKEQQRVRIEAIEY